MRARGRAGIVVRFVAHGDGAQALSILSVAASAEQLTCTIDRDDSIRIDTIH